MLAPFQQLPWDVLLQVTLCLPALDLAALSAAAAETAGRCSAEFVEFACTLALETVHRNRCGRLQSRRVAHCEGRRLGKLLKLLSEVEPRVVAVAAGICDDGSKALDGALDQTRWGDRIEVDPGIYSQWFRIDTHLELRGLGCDRGQVVLMSSNRTTLSVNVAGYRGADHDLQSVTVRNLTLDYCGDPTFPPTQSTDPYCFQGAVLCAGEGVHVEVIGCCLVARSAAVVVRTHQSNSKVHLHDCTLVQPGDGSRHIESLQLCNGATLLY